MIYIKILIAGGTGFVGKELMTLLQESGHKLVVLTRNKERAKKRLGESIEAAEWDNSYIILPSEELQDIDAVINLAGESIADGRWTTMRKEKILNSRVQTTRAIIEAIHDQVMTPKVLINASAIGFYGPREDEIITEEVKTGDDFLSQVGEAWENEARKAEELGVRVALIRIGLVLGNGGALEKMLFPYKLFVGGHLGSGNQWVSWIHIKDLVGIINYSLDHEELNGPINGTAPNPVKMKEFSKKIGSVMKRPSWLPIPGILLHILLGEMSEMLLKGQRVIPEKASHSGYRFVFPDLEAALKEILHYT